MLHKAVRTKNLNEPKRPETSQNDPKLANTTKKNCETTRNNPKFQNSDNFQLAFVFQSSSQSVQIWAFWVKSINFLILTKFCLYSISKILISNLTFVFESFQSKFPNLGIMGQKVLIFKYWQNLAYAKSLILTKFCLYPVLKVLISSLKIVFEKFLPKFPNLSILDQQTQTF